MAGGPVSDLWHLRSRVHSVPPMRIAHIGPPVARRGGPAGYLWQLKASFESAAETAPHTLTFPPTEPRVVVTPPPLAQRIRARLGRAKRAVFGAPTQYRPDQASLRRERGIIDDMLTAAAQQACIESTT